ncbi:hypothetical protein [Lentzea cavernae]|uniref:Uncharacterized protein n=1 Tax=Lentzea cavernae TaxID=2020703 RepID=A0ABQ3MSZ2_9PSEU|nr:hypothetical protein [Lentzea cavernae]GHH57740.1 hypothetical protein GCM10017774_77860 [Lentzea cavernae]
MAQEGLGRLFDLSIGFAPVDMQTAANTGKRINLRMYGGIEVVLFKGAGTAGDDPVLTLKQHTASSSGTTANLAAIDHYYVKSEQTLDGDEQWSRIAQTAAATITDPGAAGTSAEEQQIVVIPVNATALADGYDYISLDVADVGGNAQLGCVLYVARDLAAQRAPSNLVAPLS